MLRVTVTPALARRWLARATQRQLDCAKVRSLAADMPADWDPDRHVHAPVKLFGDAARNGNHRLWAILLADTAVDCWIEMKEAAVEHPTLADPARARRARRRDR